MNILLKLLNLNIDSRGKNSKKQEKKTNSFFQHNNTKLFDSNNLDDIKNPFSQNNYATVTSYEMNESNIDDVSSTPNSVSKKWSLAKKLYVSFAAVGVVLFVGAVGLYVYVSRNSSSNNSVNDPLTGYQQNIQRVYQASNDKTSLDAVKYIYQRSISLQFIFNPVGNSFTSQTTPEKIFSGTGWIFNKEKDQPIYYIATNIHVVAPLTYAGFSVPGVTGTSEDLSFYTLASTYIGFLDESSFAVNVSSSNSLNYSNPNLNLLRVRTPSIEYITTTDFDTEGFGKEYAQYNDQLNIREPNGGRNPFLNSRNPRLGSIDFALLKFDFSNDALTKANTTEASNSFAFRRGSFENVAKFEKWLQVYNQSPTEFLTQPVDSSSEEFFKRRFYMGGFPGRRNKNSSLNFSGASWLAYSNFPIAINENNIISGSSISKENYLSLASGTNQYGINLSSPTAIVDTGTVFVRSRLVEAPIDIPSRFPFRPTLRPQIQHFANNYVNVGLNGLIDADSFAGASGSMVIVNDADKFKVIGIYWGSLQFSDTNPNIHIARSFEVGTFSFLNTKMNSTKPGYNIFQSAINLLKQKTPNMNLLYDPFDSVASAINGNFARNTNLEGVRVNGAYKEE